MKNKQRKRKFVVDLANDSDNGLQERPCAKLKTTETDVLDMRITTHGKISLYASHIISEFEKNNKRTLYLYAEGAAMAKLVTVVEIVKRNAPCSASALASELSIGNTATSPCSRRPHSAQAQAQALDLADTERKQSKGIYDLKALVTGKQSTAASEEEKEEEKESKTDAKIKPNEQPWLQAKLWIREPSS